MFLLLEALPYYATDALRRLKSALKRPPKLTAKEKQRAVFTKSLVDNGLTELDVIFALLMVDVMEQQDYELESIGVGSGVVYFRKQWPGYVDEIAVWVTDWPHSVQIEWAPFCGEVNLFKNLKPPKKTRRECLNPRLHLRDELNAALAQAQRFHELISAGKAKA
jgi:hypothetical protein